MFEGELEKHELKEPTLNASKSLNWGSCWKSEIQKSKQNYFTRPKFFEGIQPDKGYNFWTEE